MSEELIAENSFCSLLNTHIYNPTMGTEIGATVDKKSWLLLFRQLA